jgi:tetrahydromethanopterin S-methyltransferase subunit G
MKNDIKTIEDLAAMIQRTMVSKEDITGVNTRLDGIDSWLDNLNARVGRIEADIPERWRLETR